MVQDGEPVLGLFLVSPESSDCHVFLISHFQGITCMTLLAEYDALNLQDFHMHLEAGSQAIVYRTPNELCAHSKFDKHTFPPFISEIAECEV